MALTGCRQAANRGADSCCKGFHAGFLRTLQRISRCTRDDLTIRKNPRIALDFYQPDLPRVRQTLLVITTSKSRFAKLDSYQ
jgi:hypothetical protein